MSKRDPYETKTVAGQRQVAKHVAKGWEVVSTASNWLAPSTVTLRRPNPKYKGEK